MAGVVRVEGRGSGVGDRTAHDSGQDSLQISAAALAGRSDRSVVILMTPRTFIFEDRQGRGKAISGVGVAVCWLWALGLAWCFSVKSMEAIRITHRMEEEMGWGRVGWGWGLEKGTAAGRERVAADWRSVPSR